MGWIEEHGLKKRLDGGALPLVLTGPLLRHTAPEATTVFLALREPRTVTLYVYEASSGGRKVVQKGSRKTVKLGAHLHVVAVTAKPFGNPPGPPLKWGGRYYYNVAFAASAAAEAPEGGLTLFSPEVFDASKDPATAAEKTRKALTYAFASALQLPCFDLPPADIGKLRIIHASCRKPHGEGHDRLTALDDILAGLKSNERRPHQLFLTGDQIYADDVADSLLLALTEAGEALLGWKETLPDIGKKPEELRPGSRKDVVLKRAGFSSGHSVSHLLGLGEFYAMYLFAWSDVLWPAELPVYADLHAGASADAAPEKRSKMHNEFDAQRRNVAEYRRTLPAIRRALANIPFYTMFDDHEVTDDWFISREWTSRVLKKPLGQRILTNALSAFAVFQGWGNTPAQFDAPGTPGGKLLDALARLNATPAPALMEELGTLLVPDLELGVSQSWYNLTHHAGAIQWYYRYVGPSYEVLVLDTRTCRAFLRGPADPPSLIDPVELVKMVPEEPAPGTEGLTIVVAPAPVVGVEFIEQAQRRIAEFEREAVGIEEKLKRFAEFKLPRLNPMVDAEAWILSIGTFERLLARLFARRQRVVILSGDVHYGFAARLRYWADRQLDAPAGAPANKNGVAVQLTASSLKNEEIKTHLLHTLGFMPGPFINAPIERGGWNEPPRVKLRWFTDDDEEEELEKVMKEIPTVIDRAVLPEGGTVDREPDWWYRIEFTATEMAAMAKAIPPPPTWSRDASMEVRMRLAKEMWTQLEGGAPGREIVGHNNLGDIIFEWQNGGRKVTQRLWWCPPGKSCGAYYSTPLSLDLADPPLAPFPK